MTMTSIIPHRDHLFRPIEKIDELEQLFISYSKKPEDRLVGIEHEKPAVVLGTQGMPLPYHKNPNSPSIVSLFESLKSHGYQPIMDEGNLVGMSKDGYSISLEPGGQIEFSGTPLSSAHYAIKQAQKHLAELISIAETQNIVFLECGFVPFASLEQVPQVPKRRYELMRNYLPQKGALGLDMMHRTCTVQVNLDYTDAQDAIFKLRLANMLGPFIAAMFAASPLKEGQGTAYAHHRFACWLDTDNSRCGVLPFTCNPNASLKDYVLWALEIPLLFVEKDGQLNPSNGMTFKEFLTNGFYGKKPSFYDWELHLSTLFPDARLRSYIETRTADAGPLETVYALPCLWQGIMYDEPTARKVYNQFSTFSYEELVDVRKKIVSSGLDTDTKLGSVKNLALSLIGNARIGLISQNAHEELAYLAPLEDYIFYTPSERILRARKSSPDNDLLVQTLKMNRPLNFL